MSDIDVDSGSNGGTVGCSLLQSCTNGGTNPIDFCQPSPSVSRPQART